MSDTVIECRAILFDLDGVLVDSRPVVERTWQHWCARHELAIPDLIQRAHGRRSIDTVREVAPALDADAEVQWLAATELNDTVGLVALPGAKPCLAALPDTRRAVVTSGGRALACLRLTHVGLPVPEVMVTAEDVVDGKPAPEGYFRAAERLDTEASSCVVIEDTPAGIAAGRAAGAITLAVTTTFSAAQLTAAELVVPSLASIHFPLVGNVVQLAIRTPGNSVSVA